MKKSTFFSRFLIFSFSPSFNIKLFFFFFILFQSGLISPLFSNVSHAQTPGPSNAGADHLQKGTRFLFSGNLEGAEKEFLEAISQNPSLHRAHFGLGLVYLQKNQPDRAEKSFQNTVALQPDYAPAYRGLGQASEIRGDLSSAVIHYQKAVSLETVNKGFSSDVAIARFRLSQIGETPETAIQARERYEKGTRLLKEKKKEEALKEFRFVLELVPDRLDALENAGVILFEEGKWEESSGLLKRILAVDPNILFARYMLGVALQSQGKAGEAWEEFHAILQIGEKTPRQKDVVNAGQKIDQLGPTKEAAIQVESKLKEAGSLYEKENLEGSEKEYREILRIVPANIKAKFGLGLIDFRKEETGEAKKLFIEVIDKEPDLLLAHFSLARIYLKEKELQKAFTELSKVMELGKKPEIEKESKKEIEEAKRELAQMGGDMTVALKVRALLDSGNDLIKKEDFDQAKEKFNQVLLLSPENLEALESLGSIYLRETSFDSGKAELLFNKILEINPELLAPRFYLAFLYDKKGEVEKAATLYQEVIRLDKGGGDSGARAKKLLAQLGETPEKAKEIHLHLRAGGELTKEKKFQEAKGEYRKVLEILPGQIQALYLIALIDLNLRNLEEAEKGLRAVISADPDHPEGHLQLGLLLGGKGDYEAAVQELEKVLSIGKEGKTVQTARVELEGLKKKEEGERHFKAGMEEMKKLDELEKISPPKPGEPLPPGQNILLQKGVGELEKAILLNQDNAYYFYNLGYAYVKKFDLVSAELMFKKAIEKRPDLLIAHYRLAVMYDLAGAPANSMKEFEKVMALGKPEDEEVQEARLRLPKLREKILTGEEARGYSIVGETLFFELKKKEEALPLLKKAAELVPDNEDYWYNLGILYEAIPDENEAAKSFEQAIKVRSNFSSPYFYLGLIQEKRGEREEAYENFKRAKANVLDPNSKEALLTQERLDFYDKKLSGSFSATLFNFDSNVNYAEQEPFVREIYSSYSLNLNYFYFKSLPLLLSSGFSSSNSIYLYSQVLVNSESLSFEARWPDLHGLSIAAGPSFGLNYVYGGLAGWNSQVKADFQGKLGWFDMVTTHIAYSYSVSALNPFYNSIREDISWAFSKNQVQSGTISASLGISSTDYVAPDNSGLSWFVSLGYSRKIVDYLTGSLSAGAGETYFKNPDSAALQEGAVFYRKNRSLSLSGSLGYTLYKNLSLSGSAAYQVVHSNTFISSALAQNQSSQAGQADLLTKQAAPIGEYQKYTLGVTVNYGF